MAATNDVVNCNKCEKEIDFDGDKFLFCTNKKCKKCFHPKCAKISDLQYKQYLKDKHKVWFCESCLSVETEKLHIRHSTHTIEKQSVETAALIHSEPPPNQAQVVLNQSNDSIQLNDMNVFMKEIHGIVKEIRVEQTNMQAQIKRLTESTEEMKHKVESLVKSNEDLKNENDFLRKTVDNCNFRINNFEQNMLANNLEICGIPENRDENLNDILNNLNNAVHGDLQEDNVICFYRKYERVNKSGLPRPIVVQLKDSNIKSKFMKKCKNLRNKLNTGLVNNIKPTRPIYVNHQLTKATSYLFMSAKKEIKNEKFKFVWVQNGKVLTRRADRGPIQQIFNINHLNDIISKY